MAGYDSPWMAMGLREDGYSVLDPRDFRSDPDSGVTNNLVSELMQLRIQAANEGAIRERGQMSPADIQADDEKRMEELQHMLRERDKMVSRQITGSAVSGGDFKRLQRALQEGVDE